MNYNGFKFAPKIIENLRLKIDACLHISKTEVWISCTIKLIKLIMDGKLSSVVMGLAFSDNSHSWELHWNYKTSRTL
jgi:hypothetical protein